MSTGFQSAHMEYIPIGQMLVDAGLINAAQRDSVLEEQKRTGASFCAILLQMGYAGEQDVFAVLSQHLGVAYVRLKERQIDRDVVGMVPARYATHYKIMPLERTLNGIVVAMAQPQDVRVIDDLRLLLGMEVNGILATEADILDAIRMYYGVGAAAIDAISSAGKQTLPDVSQDDQAHDLAYRDEDASLIGFVDQILREAIRQRATDIHLEPFLHELRTRFRIDGMLYEVALPEAIQQYYSRIVSRIKIMAHMNIVERRLPQDGRIRIKVNQQELDLRVSTIPMTSGEGVHLRILNNQYLLEIAQLGYSADNLALINIAIRKQHGIFFVTGPTGSGKSTSLYAALAQLNTVDRKIITVEEPIEYVMRGINQVQIRPEIGLTFASALRNLLRHDPDILMVGEVRDRETAEIAIRLALTGHLVLSTLHTNDAAGAVTRLIDMGIEPFLVASALECVVAQRLVRLICVDCRRQVEHKESLLASVDSRAHEIPADTVLYEGVGCSSCRFTGYRGRTGIHEVLPVTGRIRELILRRASAQQIKKAAISDGMRTLRQDGFMKVRQGLVTMQEVLRVARQEEQ